MMIEKYKLHDNKRINVKKKRKAAEKLNNSLQIEKKAEIQSNDIVLGLNASTAGLPSFLLAWSRTRRKGHGGHSFKRCSHIVV